MPNTSHDLLAELIAAQGDDVAGTGAIDPHLVEFLLDRKTQQSPSHGARDARR